jgi:uncharacterized protein
MQIPKQALLLRIFIGEDDKLGGSPLYEAIALKAREMHLAGATVLRGPMGFGASSRMHTTKNPPPLGRLAAGDRDRRQRGKDQRFLARARQDDVQRPGHEKVLVLQYGTKATSE